MCYFFTLYKRYIKISWRYRFRYLAAWILTALQLTLLNISIFAVGWAIDDLQGGGSDPFRIIFYISGILFLPIVVEPILFHIKSRIFSETIRDLTNQSHGKALNMDYRYHLEKQSGKLISILIKSQSFVNMFLWNVEWFTISRFGALLISITLVALVSPWISLAAIATIILMIPLIRFSLKFNMKRRVVLKDSEYERNSIIIDSLSNFTTVRAFGKEPFELQTLSDKTEDHRVIMNNYQNTFRVIDFTARFMGLLIFMAGGIVSMMLYQESAISLGSLVIALTYLLQMGRQVMDMIFSFREVLKELPVAEDFFEILDLESEIDEPDDPQKIIDPKGQVSFKNVSFSYDDGQEIFTDLSLKIQADSNTALVGPSGGGKSSIIKLLMRYYDIDSGEITIDGVPVDQMSTDTLRSLIALVPQEPVLFNRSIYYNVGYAMDSICDEIDPGKLKVIREACKKAQIDDFITSLPEGYETIVGERGLKLSGGQKQRIAIARAIIKDPKIVVFDEATSMLDSESEKAIQLAFTELSHNKTTVIIAHRLSTITHCDQIIVIDNGEIVEEGTHKDLVKNKGIYSNLWEIQSGGFIKG